MELQAGLTLGLDCGHNGLDGGELLQQQFTLLLLKTQLLKYVHKQVTRTIQEGK